MGAQIVGSPLPWSHKPRYSTPLSVLLGKVTGELQQQRSGDLHLHRHAHVHVGSMPKTAVEGSKTFVLFDSPIGFMRNSHRILPRM